HAGWPLVNGSTGADAVSGVASLIFFTTILGIFFGIYYERFSSSRSLIGPIAAHTLINFVRECFKIGSEPAIHGPDVIFSNSGLMASTALTFLLTFIPLFIIIWKFKIEQVTDLWSRIIGKDIDEK
ncbi:MAG: hypothetical protein RTV31_16965, partial [Candidatus Thorarchaeota archaeon]